MVVGTVLIAGALLLIYYVLRRRLTGRSDTPTDPQSICPDPDGVNYALYVNTRFSGYDTVASVRPDPESLYMNTRSPDYNTVASIRPDPNSDIYETLDMNTRSSDYETLATTRRNNDENNRKCVGGCNLVFNSRNYGNRLWTNKPSDCVSHQPSMGTNLRSPVVCILGNSCYNVTYANQTMVVSKGSTVDLFCTYQHPYNHTVIETTWYIKQEGDEVPTDLRSLPEYSGRVKYLGNNISDCSLRITDLRESDSAEYKFRFKGQFNGNSNLEWGYSFTGITLTVSDPDRVTKIIAVVGTIVFILVFIFCLSGFLWFRKKASTNRTTDTVDNKQRASNPVYDTAHGEVVTPNAEQDPHDKADVHYASVHIARSKNQVEPLYSVAQPVRPNKQEEDVQYAAVKFNCPSAATR
ncbi:hypothetical protein DPEC_G00171790 [Dallia pectoralis]|uniref:Uncharacterized protein n=1 Tax=Dallia pectoralis TaxID=75939 RepID=A0ACC2GDN8_DALPE|nr:hypothetical protein DPEC_G00171790 [Dallia pectoralis]